MTEDVLLRELRDMIARVAANDRRVGKAVGTFTEIKADVRGELLDLVRKYFGRGDIRAILYMSRWNAPAK